MNPINAILSILLIVLSILRSTLVNYSLFFNLLILVILIGILIQAVRAMKASLKIVSFLTLVLSLTAMVITNKWLWMGSQLLILLTALFVLSLSQPRLKVMRYLLWTISLVLGLLAVATSSVAVNPSLLIKMIQERSGIENSYQPNTALTIDFGDDYSHLRDLAYSEEYPNSFLDVILPKTEGAESRPTYVYFHGGGYVFGDKMAGDPNAQGSDSGDYVFYKSILDSGYNLVTVNYVFTPDYQYPIPVIQGNQALKWLEENANKIGISMDKVVLGGGSAGGNLAADLTALQVNARHAKELQITPALSKEHIKGLVLESPSLDGKRSGKTVSTNLMNDYTFGQAMAAYMGESIIAPDLNYLASISPINKVTADFPSVFISDGNDGSFEDQARDYVELLKKQNVPAQLFIPDAATYGKQGHGYMADPTSKASRVFFVKKSDFLKEIKEN